MVNFFFCKLIRVIKFFFIILLREAICNQKLFLPNATAQRSCYTLLRPFPAIGCFFKLIFCHQNKSVVVETISCFVYQLSIKYYVYNVSEHLKYCTQINEYIDLIKMPVGKLNKINRRIYPSDGTHQQKSFYKLFEDVLQSLKYFEHKYYKQSKDIIEYLMNYENISGVRNQINNHG